MPATSSSGRSTRPAAISRSPNARSSLMRSSRGSSPPARQQRSRRQVDRQRHQFAAGRIAGPAQQRAGCGDRPPGRRRRRLSAGACDGPDERSQQQRPPAPPGAREAAGRVSAEARVHEARASRRCSASSRRSPSCNGRSRARSRRHPRAGSMACSPIIAARSRPSRRSRRRSRGSRATCSTFAAAASNTRSCSARWTPTAASTTRCCSAISRSASPAASAWRRSRSSTAPRRRRCRSSRTSS